MELCNSITAFFKGTKPNKTVKESIQSNFSIQIYDSWKGLLLIGVITLKSPLRCSLVIPCYS